MPSFYDSLEPEQAEEIESLSQLTYELRENRAAVLQSHGVADEPALLARIRAGEVDEHPAYEHYLAACILADTREAVRTLIAQRLKEYNS